MTVAFTTSSLYYDDISSYSAYTQAPTAFVGNINANHKAEQQWHSLSWADASPQPTTSASNNSATVAEFLAAAAEPGGAYFKLQQLAQSLGLDVNNSTDKKQVEQWLIDLAAASSSSTSHPFSSLLNDTGLSSSDVDGESESAYSIIAREFRLFFYALIFIICVFGNALVVITLAQNRRMRTVTNIFLINLAASDLLLGVFCMPFTLIGAMLREWIFGEFMCRAISYFQCSTVVTSAVTLVCISLERYFAICRPLQSRRWQTKSHAYMMCIFCWLFGLLCALPIPILSQLIPMVPPDVVFDPAEYNGPYKCREVYPQPQWIYEFFYQLFLSFCILVIPLILMVGFYTLITLELYRDINVPTTPTNGGAVLQNQQQPLCNAASNASSTYFFTSNKPILYSVVNEPTTQHQTDTSPAESEVSSPIRAIRCSGSRQSVAHTPHLNDNSKLISQINGNTNNRHYDGNGGHSSTNGTIANSSNGSLRRNHKRTLTSFSLRQQPSLDSIVTTTTTEQQQHTRGMRAAGVPPPLSTTRTTTVCSSYSADKLTDGLRSTHTERNLATKKKVIVMLITVVIEFFICFTPITIFNLVAIAAPSQAYLVPSWGISFIQLLMYISTCCNPITYCFLNKKFRQGFKFAFSCGKARRLRQLQQSTNQSVMTPHAGGSRANTVSHSNTVRVQVSSGGGGGPLTITHSHNAGADNNKNAAGQLNDIVNGDKPTNGAHVTTTQHDDEHDGLLGKVTIC